MKRDAGEGRGKQALEEGGMKRKQVGEAKKSGGDETARAEVL